MAECILCGSDAGVIVLDLGAQPSPRHWPLPTDPLPDPTHALALRLCPDCGLAQLDADDTTEGQDAHGGREQHLGATKDAEFRADPRILRC